MEIYCVPNGKFEMGGMGISQWIRGIKKWCFISLITCYEWWKVCCSTNIVSKVLYTFYVHIFMYASKTGEFAFCIACTVVSSMGVFAYNMYVCKLCTWSEIIVHTMISDNGYGNV